MDVSVGRPSVRFTSTMPFPPARFTSADLSARSITPRSQTTILPAVLARLSVSGAQTAASVPVAEARLTDRAVTSRARPTSPKTVVLIPAYFLPLPRTTVPAYGATVLAATVVTQGVTWFRVDAPAPALPAEVATKIPAEAADRNAKSTGSSTVSEPPTE